MGRFARSHYLVSPFLSENECRSLREQLGIIGIKTDGAFFVETVKEHMRNKFCFVDERSFERMAVDLFKVEAEHINFVKGYSVEKEPHLVFATAYQDGLIHCLQRIVDRRLSGEYANLHRIRGQASLYQDRIDEYTRRRDYWNASYFVGYQTGLIYFDVVNADLNPSETVPEDLKTLPYYYHPKLGHMTREEYAVVVRPNPDCHKGALKQALRFGAIYAGSPDMVVQHTPFG